MVLLREFKVNGSGTKKLFAVHWIGSVQPICRYLGVIWRELFFRNKSRFIYKYYMGGTVQGVRPVESKGVATKQSRSEDLEQNWRFVTGRASILVQGAAKCALLHALQKAFSVVGDSIFEVFGFVRGDLAALNQLQQRVSELHVVLVDIVVRRCARFVLRSNRDSVFSDHANPFKTG